MSAIATGRSVVEGVPVNFSASKCSIVLQLLEHIGDFQRQIYNWLYVSQVNKQKVTTQDGHLMRDVLKALNFHVFLSLKSIADNDVEFPKVKRDIERSLESIYHDLDRISNPVVKENLFKSFTDLKMDVDIHFEKLTSFFTPVAIVGLV